MVHHRWISIGASILMIIGSIMLIVGSVIYDDFDDDDDDTASLVVLIIGTILIVVGFIIAIGAARAARARNRAMYAAHPAVQVQYTYASPQVQTYPGQVATTYGGGQQYAAYPNQAQPNPYPPNSYQPYVIPSSTNSNLPNTLQGQYEMPPPYAPQTQPVA